MLTIYYPLSLADAIAVAPRADVMPVEHDRSRITRACGYVAHGGSVITCDDIFVRRVLRAVQSGDIGPGDVCLLFVAGRDDVQRIEIDSRGRVACWPDGFMTEDLAESRRWLDGTFAPLADE